MRSTSRGGWRSAHPCPRAGPGYVRPGTRVRDDRCVTPRRAQAGATIDQAGIVQRAGVAGITVAKWIAGSPANGFPQRLPGRRDFDLAAVEQWLADREAKRLAGLTPIDRSGDAEELVTKTQAARILGYKDGTSLDNNPLWPLLLERNDPAHNQPLPAGGERLYWPRRVVWEVGEQRDNRRGSPAGTGALGRVRRTGDPDEPVGVTEAARVLGYRDYRQLQLSAEWPILLSRVDERVPDQMLDEHEVARWQRRTLWTIADERTVAAPRRAVRETGGPRVIDRSGRPDELVGTTQAARILGYTRYQSLPKALLQRADTTEDLGDGRVRRKFRRRTLWRYADENLPAEV